MSRNVPIVFSTCKADPELCEAECVETEGKGDNSPDKCLFMGIGPSTSKMQDYSCICFRMITSHVKPWSVGEYSIFLGGKEEFT